MASAAQFLPRRCGQTPAPRASHSSAEQLRAVVAAQELKAQFWSAIEMDGANVDFELTPGTLGRIAALGATLRLDIYAPEDVARDIVEIPDTDDTPAPSHLD